MPFKENYILHTAFYTQTVSIDSFDLDLLFALKSVLILMLDKVAVQKQCMLHI